MVRQVCSCNILRRVDEDGGLALTTAKLQYEDHGKYKIPCSASIRCLSSYLLIVVIYRTFASHLPTVSYHHIRSHLDQSQPQKCRTSSSPPPFWELLSLLHKTLQPPALLPLSLPAPVVCQHTSHQSNSSSSSDLSNSSRHRVRLDHLHKLHRQGR